MEYRRCDPIYCRFDVSIEWKTGVGQGVGTSKVKSITGEFLGVIELPGSGTLMAIRIDDVG
jgi:hypothetical protein